MLTVACYGVVDLSTQEKRSRVQTVLRPFFARMCLAAMRFKEMLNFCIETLFYDADISATRIRFFSRHSQTKSFFSDIQFSHLFCFEKAILCAESDLMEVFRSFLFVAVVTFFPS